MKGLFMFHFVILWYHFIGIKILGNNKLLSSEGREIMRIFSLEVCVWGEGILYEPIRSQTCWEGLGREEIVEVMMKSVEPKQNFLNSRCLACPTFPIWGWSMRVCRCDGNWKSWCEEQFFLPLTVVNSKWTMWDKEGEEWLIPSPQVVVLTLWSHCSCSGFPCVSVPRILRVQIQLPPPLGPVESVFCIMSVEWWKLLSPWWLLVSNPTYYQPSATVGSYPQPLLFHQPPRHPEDTI